MAIPIDTHGPYPNRLDYARNDYYPDPAPSAAGYIPALYMNVNMGGQGQGGAGAYGGGSASVLEDQLTGTYRGGIHRLQGSSLRQGPSPGKYGARSAGGYMGAGGLGAVGGHGGSKYDLDLVGFRSAGSFSGPPSVDIGATGGGDCMVVVHLEEARMMEEAIWVTCQTSWTFWRILVCFGHESLRTCRWRWSWPQWL